MGLTQIVRRVSNETRMTGKPCGPSNREAFRIPIAEAIPTHHGIAHLDHPLDLFLGKAPLVIGNRDLLVFAWPEANHR